MRERMIERERERERGREERSAAAVIRWRNDVLTRKY
jgi:hypothetical protein